LLAKHLIRIRFHNLLLQTTNSGGVTACLGPLVSNGELTGFAEHPGGWLMLAVESCIVDILIDLISSVYYLVGHSVTLENKWHFGPSVNLLTG
jgi:hypothetical protein